MRRSALVGSLLVVVAMVVPGVTADHGYENVEPTPDEYPLKSPVTNYHLYAFMKRELDELAAQYPDFFKYKVIGKSVLGLDIYGIEITNFKSTDPPMDQRYRLYFDGAIHGNEQLGMETAMDIVYWLLEDYNKDPLAKLAVDHRRTFIIPMVNPDGNVRDSRWNVNNVDLNRNFPHGFGGPGSAARGPRPLSEPETQAVAKFFTESNPHYGDSFHTGIVMLLHPLGNYSRGSNITSPDHDLYTSICQGIQEEMNKAAGRPVPCGQVFSTIYPASGTTVDYMYVELGTISFTFEVDNEQGLYVHPGDKASLRARLGEAWASVKHAYENVHRYGALLEILELKSRLRDGKVTALEVQIKNTGLGASNNAVVQLTDGTQKIGVPLSVNPSIQPDEVRRIVIPVSTNFQIGSTIGLELAYNRTFFKGFSTNEIVPLEAVKQGANVILRQAGGAAAPAAIDDGADSATPGFELGLLVLSAVGAVWAFRRRSG